MSVELNRCVLGDCRRTLLDLPDSTFACCVTSPPYWGLRDYGHIDQIGLESTPDEYVQQLVEVFRQVHRVLRDDGTLWLNLGDSYAGAAGGGQGKNGRCAAREASTAGVREGLDKRAAGIKPKDLVGIPWRVAFALQQDGWYLRSDIIWHKPNPMPESVSDRPTKAHEYIFLLSKCEQYYFDGAAVREPESNASTARYAYAAADGRINKAGAYREAFDGIDSHGLLSRARTGMPQIPTDGKRNCRTVWPLPTQPYAGAHFATMPPKLVERCVLAGSPLGAAVLDPFFGSGTTGQVAEQLGRRWLGCELSETYARLAAKRTEQSGLQFVESDREVQR